MRRICTAAVALIVVACSTKTDSEAEAEAAPAPITGPATLATLPASDDITAIAVDETYAYWITRDDAEIRHITLHRVPKRGGAAETLATVDGSGAREYAHAQALILFVDADNVYFGSDDGLMALAKTPSAKPHVALDIRHLGFAAADGNAIYATRGEQDVVRLAHGAATAEKIATTGGPIMLDHGDVWIEVDDNVQAHLTAAQLAKHDLTPKRVEDPVALRVDGEAWWSAYNEGLRMYPRGGSKAKAKLVRPVPKDGEVRPVASDAAHVYAIERDHDYKTQLLAIDRGTAAAQVVAGSERVVVVALDGHMAYLATATPSKKPHDPSTILPEDWAITRVPLP